MAKVTVIGGGNVGATCANVLAHKDIVNEVVTIDLQADLARGKMLDSWQQAPIDHYSTRTVGSGDYADTANSDIVVITAGVPRKPGMTRDDLVSTNAKIVNSVIDNVLKYSANPIIIMVSNPLDVMTYAALKKSGLPRERVIGMAGILDTARYRAFLASELKVSPKDIQAVLMGGHGDTMVPLPRYTTVAGIPITEMVAADKLHEIIERTKNGGGELVKLMGTSAWYAPGAAAAQMVEAIVKNEQRVYPCCVLLEGEYGIKGLCVGVPVVLGAKGVERIIELQLNDAEKADLYASANAVSEIVEAYNKMVL